MIVANGRQWQDYDRAFDFGFAMDWMLGHSHLRRGSFRNGAALDVAQLVDGFYADIRPGGSRWDASSPQFADCVPEFQLALFCAFRPIVRSITLACRQADGASSFYVGLRLRPPRHDWLIAAACCFIRISRRVSACGAGYESFYFRRSFTAHAGKQVRSTNLICRRVQRAKCSLASLFWRIYISQVAEEVRRRVPRRQSTMGGSIYIPKWRQVRRRVPR